MATQINFYLNNNLANPPKNWQELELEVNYNKDRQRVSALINQWEFVRENSDIIRAWLPNALNGLPFRIDIVNNTTTEVVFDGYLDFTDNAIFSCKKSTINAKEKKGIDFLNDKADSFTFEYLYAINYVTKEDFVFVPYVINSIPNTGDIMINIVSLYVMSIQLIHTTKEITKSIAKVSANPTAYDEIISLTFEILFAITLIAAIIKLILDIINVIIQPIKYHATMRVIDLLTKGAEYLGFTFETDLLDEIEEVGTLMIMPQKEQGLSNEFDDRILGYSIPNKNKQRGYFKGTYGDLLRALLSSLNAKLIIDNNVIKMVSNEYILDTNVYNIPDIEVEEFEVNLSDFSSNYQVKFKTDLVEKNTIKEYEGTSCQVFTRPQTINNEEYYLGRGLTVVDIPFALAKIKKDFSAPEKVIITMLDVVSTLANGYINVINIATSGINAIIKVINKIIKALGVVGINLKFQFKTLPKIQPFNLSGLIEERIGMLLLDIDITNEPKLFLLKESNTGNPRYNKIPFANYSYINANYFYEKFHSSNSFISSDLRPFGNQKIIKNYDKVPFCLADYLKVKTNNTATDASGSVGIIESIRWNIYKQQAILTFKKPELYLENLAETKLLPNGA